MTGFIAIFVLPLLLLSTLSCLLSFLSDTSWEKGMTSSPTICLLKIFLRRSWKDKGGLTKWEPSGRKDSIKQTLPTDSDSLLVCCILFWVAHFFTNFPFHFPLFHRILEVFVKAECKKLCHILLCRTVHSHFHKTAVNIIISKYNYQ